jgi:hypothetical protein
MHRNRTWNLDPIELRTQRNRILPIEGGDGATLSLDFMTGVLDPRITFSRTTDATFINSQGLVQYADANMAIRSDELTTTPAWTQQAATPASATGVIAPTGATAFEVLATSGSSSHLLYQTVTTLVASGLAYTLSAYVKKKDHDFVAIGLYSSGSGGKRYTALFSIPADGTGSFQTSNDAGTSPAGTAYSISHVGGGWYRISVTMQASAADIYPHLMLAKSASPTWTSAQPIFAFDNGGTYYASAQLNVGSYASNYVVATSAQKYDQPRFDYDPTTLQPRGLLVEGTATNLFTYSETFTDSVWQKVGSTIDTTSVVGPDGVAATTRRVKENSSTDQHGIRRQFTCAAGSTHTVSVFVKKGSYDSFVFEFWGGGTFNAKAVYSTIDGSTPPTLTFATGVNASVTKTSFPQTGWHRYTLTFTNPTAGAILADFNVLLKESNAYLGNGTNYMDVYGFSIEAGSGASSYIPTAASQGTRAQDLAAITGANFSSWWTSNNPASFLIDLASTSRPIADRIFRIADSSGSAYGYGAYFNSTTMPMQVRAVMSSASSSDVSIGANLAANTRTKIGFTVETASLKRFRDGVTASTLATPTLPPNLMTQMFIGGNPTFGNASADFHIKQFKYWPTTLSDSAMQGYTT